MGTPCGKPEDTSIGATNPRQRPSSHPADRQTAGTAQEPTPFHLGHRRWLDGLRGLAVLLVLAFHLHLVPGGSFGVDVFFVLSGFLITSLLVEEWRRRGSISLKRFYLRRGLRLLPAFLTLLLLGFLYTLVFRATDEADGFRKEMVVAVCYLTNWPALHHNAMATLGHTWSLSVEEQFYLIWPMLLYGMLRARLTPRTIILVVLVGILGSASLRVVLFEMRPPPGPERALTIARLYMGLDTRADALLIGCLVGLLTTWERLPTSRFFHVAIKSGALVSTAGLAYVFFLSCFDHHLYYYGLFTMVALMVAVILVRLLTASSRLSSGVLESGALVGVGRISYALYLFHVPIIHWLRPAQLGWTAPANTLLVTGLSFAAAMISYYGIERPCLRLKLRLQSPGSGSPTSDVLRAGVCNEVAGSPRVAA
jgi:peptidoglycan/LPS O-acetylase OafA/YrhL